MCLNPITIPNNAKVVPTSSYFRYKNTFACGQCSECQLRKSMEWKFRITTESEDTFLSNGYIYSDCLTYSPHYHPVLGDYFDVPIYSKLKVFDYVHVRDFMKDLRSTLSYYGYDVEENLRFFYVSEYGERNDCTHRAHYHILFFVRNNFIEPLKLSEFVSKCWSYGRTEGLPYKPVKYVLDHNTIKDSPLSLHRVSSYVAKYLEKDSLYFTKVISKIFRILKIEYGSIDLSNKAQKNRYKELYYRVRPFHRQSLGFGASALGSIDLNEVYKNNTISLKIPSKDFVLHLPLPMYYKRKLFYDVYEKDKQYVWVENDLGKIYNYKRFLDRYYVILDRLLCLNEQYNTNFTPELASYIAYTRFSNGMPYIPITFLEKLDAPHIYQYRSVSDLEYFKKPFFSFRYVGNNKVGYRPNDIELVTAPDMLRSSSLEHELSLLDSVLLDSRKNKQNYYDLIRRQHYLKSKLKTSML